MSLERKTPLKKKRDTPRRVPKFTCSIRGCTYPPRDFPYCAKHARLHADDLFARYIKARDRRCQNCPETTNLQCAHIIRRRYYAIRWDPDNAVTLCRACHKRYTEDELGWQDWVFDRIGEDAYRAMKFRAQRGGMPDLAYTIAELRAMLKEVAA